jgi:hypothetical protein
LRWFIHEKTYQFEIETRQAVSLLSLHRTLIKKLMKAVQSASLFTHFFHVWTRELYSHAADFEFIAAAAAAAVSYG